MMLFPFIALSAVQQGADIFVNPASSWTGNTDGSRLHPVRTLHDAAALVRLMQAEAERPLNVTVLLAPGLHHVGDKPLRLGPADGGDTVANTWVVWKSADRSNPAVIGAPIRVTGT